MSSRRHGFTIVELIVVVIVIGILASLTIIAYNGSQRRAQGAQILAAAKEWEKLFKNYYVTNNGSYQGLFTSAGCQPYLGQSASEFTNPGCSPYFNQTIVDKLKAANGGSDVPVGKLPTLKSSYQGIRYYGVQTGDVELRFVQPGNGCPAGTVFTNYYLASIDVSECHIYLQKAP